MLNTFNLNSADVQQRTTELALELYNQPVNVQKALALIAAGVDTATNAVEGLEFPLPLIAHAAASGALDVVKALVEAGADPRLAGPYGATALEVAAAGERADVAKYLVSRGADVNRRDSDALTLLMRSLAEGNNNAAKILIDCDADVTLTDDAQRKAIDYVGSVGFSSNEMRALLTEKEAQQNDAAAAAAPTTIKLVPRISFKRR